MWKTEYTAKTTATPATIWKLWSDVANWKAWDAQLETSRLEGSFAVGSRCTLKQKDGREIVSELTQVQPNVGFSDRTLLPESTTLDFIHEVGVVAGETHVTHRVVLDGLLAEQFATQIGEGLHHGLEEAVHGLVQLAENSK